MARVLTSCKEFADVLILARLTADSGGKRLMWTVYSGAVNFHALLIVYSSLCPSQESRSQLDSALTEIFAIASKAIGEDERQIYRGMWALSVALHKTNGCGNQHWLSKQLDRARVMFPNLAVPGFVLQNT